ncbi:MAG: ABC transporter permease, partial [Tepidisphaeraceae bacterium]
GRKVMYLIDPRKKRKPFGSRNPLIAKEARTNNLRSGRWMIRTFYGSLFLSLALAVMSLYGGTEHADLLAHVAQILVAFQIGVIALVDPSLTAPAVSAEIENGTFETLRMTRLSGGQIFWGKFIPAFLPAMLPVLALLPAYIAICFVQPDYLKRVQLLLPVVVLAVVFCCTLGLLCSSFVSNTARSTVAAYVITAALFVLPLLAWWAGGNQISVAVAKWLAMPSPLVMATTLMESSQNPSPMTLEVQKLWSKHLALMGAICLAMLLVARVRLSMLLRQG